jgi:hypothetical protein
MVTDVQNNQGSLLHSVIPGSFNTDISALFIVFRAADEQKRSDFRGKRPSVRNASQEIVVITTHVFRASMLPHDATLLPSELLPSNFIFSSLSLTFPCFLTLQTATTWVLAAVNRSDTHFDAVWLKFLTLPLTTTYFFVGFALYQNTSTIGKIFPSHT